MEKNVFRAGTIGAFAQNTAYGYVKKYMEENDLVFSPARVEEITEGIFGSKRTTGQHPGGIIVIPDEYEIEDFTPVNYPADDQILELLLLISHIIHYMKQF